MGDNIAFDTGSLAAGRWRKSKVGTPVAPVSFLHRAPAIAGGALPGIMLGFSLLVLLVIPKGVEKQA